MHMNQEASLRPTSVRHSVVFATTVAAFLMYLDRACLAWMLKSPSFESEMHLSETQINWLKSAFFWAYALMQVPAGWLAERVGKRTLMTVLILLWSAFTALSGFANGFITLLIARLGCGIAEAGAYPISSSLLSRWSHVNWRGFASGVVSLGGRLGGAAAPILTASVIAYYGNWRMAGWIYGFAGIFFGWYFWRTFRETPEEHPRCNDAERAYLAEGRAPVPAEEKHVRHPFPWRSVVTDGSLWFMCGLQFFTNMGWAFLINSLSGYLQGPKRV